MDRRKKQRRRLCNLPLRFEIGKQLRNRFPPVDEIPRFLSQNDSRRRVYRTLLLDTPRAEQHSGAADQLCIHMDDKPGFR